MATPFLAQIVPCGFNFAPRGYAMCSGQAISIAQNTALFSILGTTFGGNGQTTFALPDLRGRAPMHPGSGPGLTPRVLGEVTGTETHTLTLAQLPSHSHGGGVASAQACSTGPGTTNTANAKFPAVTLRPMYADAPSGSTGGGTSSATGGSQPHNNMQPVLALNFVIALEGIFPSRN